MNKQEKSLYRTELFNIAKTLNCLSEDENTSLKNLLYKVFDIIFYKRFDKRDIDLLQIKDKEKFFKFLEVFKDLPNISQVDSSNIYSIMNNYYFDYYGEFINYLNTLENQKSEITQKMELASLSHDENFNRIRELINKVSFDIDVLYFLFYNGRVGYDGSYGYGYLIDYQKIVNTFNINYKEKFFDYLHSVEEFVAIYPTHLSSDIINKISEIERLYDSFIESKNMNIYEDITNKKVRKDN